MLSMTEGRKGMQVMIVRHMAKKNKVENNCSIKKRKDGGDAVTLLGDLLFKENSIFKCMFCGLELGVIPLRHAFAE